MHRLAPLLGPQGLKSKRADEKDRGGGRGLSIIPWEVWLIASRDTRARNISSKSSFRGAHTIQLALDRFGATRNLESAGRLIIVILSPSASLRINSAKNLAAGGGPRPTRLRPPPDSSSGTPQKDELVPIGPVTRFDVPTNRKTLGRRPGDLDRADRRAYSGFSPMMSATPRMFAPRRRQR